MSKLTCPHCGRTAFSALRKVFVGPALPGTCEECNRTVGVPSLRSFAANIPLLAALAFGGSEAPFALKSALWVGGFLLTCVLQVRWVPLEPR